MKTRIGVVGMGLMGDLHAKVYRSLPQVELVGLVETDTTRRQELEARFGVKVFVDLKKLLAEVDALSICTPDQLHKEPILEAFRSGVRVLVEKPLAMSVSDGEEIIRAMPDPSFLMVGHVLRFDPRILHCKQLLEQGAVGKIWTVNIRRNNTVAAGQKLGGRTSVAWFLGIHDIDLLLWLSGLRVERITAVGRKYFSRYWDYVHAHLEMEREVIASIEESWIMPNVRSSGLDAGIKIVGDSGMIEVNLTHSDVAVSTTANGRQMNLDTYHWPVSGGVPYGDLRRELASFVSSVEKKVAPPVTAEEAMEAVRVVERVEAALLSGGAT